MSNVLVVDDDHSYAEVLKEKLRRAGYEVYHVASGYETLQFLSNQGVDLIILDLHLPDLTGLSLVKWIKEQESTSRIPIICITAYPSGTLKLQCLEEGVDDFIAKPTDEVELLARVKSLIRSKQLSDRLFITYHEMDQVGAFSEAVAYSPLADWKRDELAAKMALQILGPSSAGIQRPKFLWGGRPFRRRIIGMKFYYQNNIWQQETTLFSPQDLMTLLKPYKRGSHQYFNSQTFPPELRSFFDIPEALKLDNFAAYITENYYSILVAGYPWEVGSFEIPLLRTMVRHWRVFERLRQQAKETEEAFYYTLETLAVVAEYYDQLTSAHIRRFEGYAHILGRAIGLGSYHLRQLTRSAITHDVGKIIIPKALIQKRGKLSPEEWEVVKRHTVEGERLLGHAPQLHIARRIARSHHENYDGTGYPDGLSGQDIPFEARLVKIIDIYDALRSERPYKKAYSHEETLKVLQKGDERVKPEHLDPRLLEAFLDSHKQIAEAFREATSGES